MRPNKWLLLTVVLGLLSVQVSAGVIEDFDTIHGSIDWNSAVGPPYYTTINLNATGVTGKGLAVTEVQAGLPLGHSGNALVHGLFITAGALAPQDWTAFSTLEFDAKVSTTNLTGYSVRLGNWDTTQPAGQENHGVLVRAIQVSTSGSFVHVKIDISGAQRDAICEITLYVNRTNQDAGQTLTVDNFEVTNNSVPAIPATRWIEWFGPYGSIADMFAEGGTKPWNHVFHVALALNTSAGQPQGAPYDDTKCGDITVDSSNHASSYAQWWSGAPNQMPIDFHGYNSIIVDAKVTRGTAVRPPPLPIGLSMVAVGPTASPARWLFPSAYGTWQTFRFPLGTADQIEQLKWLWFYVNKSTTADTYQIVQIDNVRLSTDTAPAIPPFDGVVDDFENGDITWWYYESYHDEGAPLVRYNGVSHALTSDAASGQKALKITNGDPTHPEWPGSWYAYNRKTFMQNWSGYKTLCFDAKMADSSTQQGFWPTIKISGTYYYHKFWPTTSWKTYKIDVSGLSRSEVNQLSFYVNRGLDYAGGAFGQNKKQELYLDNIRLTNDSAWDYTNSIGEAKVAPTGTERVDANGKYTDVNGKPIGATATYTIYETPITGVLTGAFPDKYNPTVMRQVFFIEETDPSTNRTSAMPVIWDGSAEAWDGTQFVDIPLTPGDKVNVTGVMQMDKGNRVIYATVKPFRTAFGTPAKPVAITNKNCAGFPAGNLDTVGMLVTITGKATAYKTDLLGRSWLYVDDGSNVTADLVPGSPDPVQMSGVKVLDTLWGTLGDFVGKYVVATGFAMNEPEIDPTSTQLAQLKSTGRFSRALYPQAEIYLDAVREVH